MPRWRNDLKVGARLVIGDVTIMLERKSGQIARLAIEAPQSVTVRLEESTANTDETIRLAAARDSVIR